MALILFEFYCACAHLMYNNDKEKMYRFQYHITVEYLFEAVLAVELA